ncbi:MAG: hypothetical protein EOP40_08420 [Rubrivivax sp.]|nr:MAG: hypothetical protein EOP40_08420 [Rubrivivax sp.]
MSTWMLCAWLAWPLWSCATAPPAPAAASPQRAQVLPHRGMAFTQARAQVIQAGWVPERLPREEGLDYEALEQELVDQGVTEVAMCSIDTSSCIFHYRRAAHCLRLDAVGEHLALMKVVAVSARCPAVEATAGG